MSGYKICEWKKTKVGPKSSGYINTSLTSNQPQVLSHKNMLWKILKGSDLDKHWNTSQKNEKYWCKDSQVY